MGVSALRSHARGQGHVKTSGQLSSERKMTDFMRKTSTDAGEGSSLMKVQHYQCLVPVMKVQHYKCLVPVMKVQRYQCLVPVMKVQHYQCLVPVMKVQHYKCLVPREMAQKHRADPLGD
uniref:Uncharacterized protein n=1 Tax=Nothobranchius furzeri TaxID=105023 RepID=A0A8C6NWF6_NOTFU